MPENQNAMEFVPEDISAYCERFTQPESEVLQELNRETYAKVLMPRMLSGHLQGRFLSFISQMIQPKNILEIGTYTGYSALCMAEGLAAGGKLITIDINEELEDMVNRYIDKAGLTGTIDMRIGNALDIVPTLGMKFDLVFIDADKGNYSNYFDLVIDQLNPGGYILADNVLWSGKVLDDKQDDDTAALVAYSEKLKADPRVEQLMLPIRDGILIARKTV